MPELSLNLIKGDTVSDNTDYRDALPVNMYGVKRTVFGAEGYMCQESGLSLYAIGEGVDRGGIWWSQESSSKNGHYRLSGTSFIKVNSDKTITNIGTIRGSDTARFAYSFNNIAIVVEGNLYMYNPANGLRQITDPDVGSPIDVTWIDGYFCYTDGDNIYHSSITDETEIDPLDFATSEFSPDPTIGVGKSVDNFWVVFDRYTTEFFRNVATENFAFSRVSGRALNVGIVGTNAKTQVDDAFFAIGNRRNEAISIYALTAGRSQNLATREIEIVLGQYNESDLSSAIVESIKEDGYQFVLFHLPNETLKYNVTIGGELGWSILKSDIRGESTYRAVHAVFDNNAGAWLFGDKISSNIGLLDNTVATQYEDLIEWLLYTPFYKLDSVSIDRLELETISGFTLSSDVRVFCSITNNAVDYTREFMISYGDYADYNKRFIKHRLGYVRNYVSFKLRGVSSSRMAFSRGIVSYG